MIISPTGPKEGKRMVGFRMGMRTEEGHLGRASRSKGAEGWLSAGASQRVVGYYNGQFLLGKLLILISLWMKLLLSDLPHFNREHQHLA